MLFCLRKFVDVPNLFKYTSSNKCNYVLAGSPNNVATINKKSNNDHERFKVMFKYNVMLFPQYLCQKWCTVNMSTMFLHIYLQGIIG